MISRAFKYAVAGMALAAVMGPAAHAAAPADKNVRRPDFIYHQNDMFGPSYSIARREMEPTYRVQPNDIRNPLIGIAEEDLDGDGMPEIIARPIEEMEETGLFCTPEHDGLCPFYVLQVRDRSVRTLGVIWADSIALDAPKNGFWTIRAYTQERGNGTGYETWIYNKSADRYERQGPAVSPLPPPAAPEPATP